MKTPEEQLQELRLRIDQVDAELTRLLIERTNTVRAISQLKAASWPGASPIRPGREGQLHRKIVERFKGTPVTARMALTIWRQLIGGSVHLESPINVTYLRNYPEHRFFAREYFGVQVNSHSAVTLSEALADIRSGKTSILVLPHPESHGWWNDSAELQRMGLRIFAALPVETSLLPPDCTQAVALANVAPEDSGNDVSYFVSAKGELEIIPGFVSERAGATFLGTHPLPIPGAPHA